MAEHHHVIVVGGSWAGLAAAMLLGRARRRVLVVDAGQPRNRFAHASHGFLGQDGRPPVEILDTFRAQALAYPTVRLRTAEAAHAERTYDGRFGVALATGETLEAERLILATGVVDALPTMPGLEERWGATVLHCPYCHGYEVRDRRLGVLASSEKAAQKAMLLPDWSADVTLFTNGAFEPGGEQRAGLESRGVRIVEQPVDALVGAAPALDGVRLRDGAVIPVNALFVETTTRVASPLAELLGCAFEENPQGAFVRTDDRRQTTVPGVFCAGDAARGMHNATFAAADGAMAGIAAHQSLVFAAAAAR